MLNIGFVGRTSSLSRILHFLSLPETSLGLHEQPVGAGSKTAQRCLLCDIQEPRCSPLPPLLSRVDLVTA